MKKYELGFYSIYKVLFKLGLTICLGPILLFLVFKLNPTILKENPILLFLILFLPAIVFILLIKRSKLKDQFTISSEGIRGEKSELFKWENIKSLEQKYMFYGGGTYIKMKLTDNRVFHYTPAKINDSNTLEIFLVAIKELKIDSLTIKTK
jgi:hypothetical protein